MAGLAAARRGAGSGRAALGVAVGALALVMAAVSGGVAAHADEAVPARKAGLWEVRTVTGERSGPGLTVRQCVDTDTDAMLLSLTGPFADTACPRRDVTRSGDTVTVEAACTAMNRAATARAVITGSFERAYEMTVTARGDAVPGGAITLTTSGTWLGPCTAGQRPGDVVMPGGLTLNIRDMRKLSPSTGMPLPR